MAKVTKKQLEKQVVELQSKVDSLQKENDELKTRLITFEKMPETVGQICGTLWSTFFPPQQAGQK